MNKINSKINKPIQLQVALIPVCKMVIRFGLHFNEFIRNMQKAYIQAAEEILIQSDNKPTLQAIAIKTGMDRRTISEHKNNTLKHYSNPMNKMDMVIVQLQILNNKKGVKTLPLKQIKHVIDAIYAQHIRSNAIIKELITNQIIKKIDDNTFKLNLTLNQQTVDIRMMAEDVDFTAKRLFQTYYKNMFNNKCRQKNTLMQSTCLSSKIALRHHKKVNQLIKRELNISENKIKNIINKYESNIPENSYPEIGVTQFQFNSLDS
jgi:hypothetical protein